MQLLQAISYPQLQTELLSVFQTQFLPSFSEFTHTYNMFTFVYFGLSNMYKHGKHVFSALRSRKSVNKAMHEICKVPRPLRRFSNHCSPFWPHFSLERVYTNTQAVEPLTCSGENPLLPDRVCHKAFFGD